MTVLLDGDARLVASGHTLSVSGEAGFDVATALAAAGCVWLREQAQGSRIRFDLSQVNQATSAALSVVLEWLRCAQRHRLVVEAVRLSPPLSRITAMAGLDRLLPGETAEHPA